MTKVKVAIDSNIRRDFEGKLDDAIVLLNKYRDSIPEEWRDTAYISIDTYDDYGDPSVDIEVGYYRPETVEETAKREAAIARRQAAVKAAEMEQLRKLQAKYGTQ